MCAIHMSCECHFELLIYSALTLMAPRKKRPKKQLKLSNGNGSNCPNEGSRCDVHWRIFKLIVGRKLPISSWCHNCDYQSVPFASLFFSQLTYLHYNEYNDYLQQIHVVRCAGRDGEEEKIVVELRNILPMFDLHSERRKNKNLTKSVLIT